MVYYVDRKTDLFHHTVAEAIEDIAITMAIKEGESTESVSKAVVFKIIEGRL